MALEKLFKTYFYSSAHDYNSFKFDDYSGEKYTFFDAFCFSTDNTQIYLTGADSSRYEKTDYIADYELPQRKLLVCRNPYVIDGKIKNCSKCSKCTRTMLDLDIYGKLDKFINIFDVEYYKNHKTYYWGYLFYKGRKDPFIAESLVAAKKNGIKIPFGSRFAGFIKILKNGFKRGNPLQYTYKP